MTSKVIIKTKALVSTLQSLLALPSISASMGGDVLPEAVLIKNILEEMMASLTILTSLVHHLGSQWLGEAFLQKIPTKLLPKVLQFKQILSALDKSGGPSDEMMMMPIEDYDADTEGDDRMPSRKERRLKRRDKIRSESSIKGPLFVDSAVDEEAFIHISRDLLLLIQNDPELKRDMSSIITQDNSRKSLAKFVQILDEFQNYSVSVLSMPYQVYIQECESLCSSIFMTQRQNKIINKNKTILEDILQSQRNLLQTKAEEKAELQESVNSVRLKADETITDMKNNIDNKIKILAWNSHGRQLRTTELVMSLKKELEEATTEHVQLETELRHTNIQLETEIDSMINKFDSEMFRLHNEIESLRDAYETEKVELRQAKSVLEEIQRRKSEILEMKRAEEDEDRNQELTTIRRRIAAKVIQRAWRAYRARMMLKSKKKKKKK